MHKFRLLLPFSLIAFTGAALAADAKGPGRPTLQDLDSNGDELISLAEFQEGENNALTEMDADLNGVLTIDEFINARPNMGMRMGRGDGPGAGARPNADAAPRGQREPSAEEMAKMQELRTLRATERFQSVDTNDDEIVTLQEFQAGMFAELDHNADGVLDVDEQRPPRMGRPGPGNDTSRGPRPDHSAGQPNRQAPTRRQ